MKICQKYGRKAENRDIPSQTFLHEEPPVDELQSFLLNRNFNRYIVFQRAKTDVRIKQEILQTLTEETYRKEPER